MSYNLNSLNVTSETKGIKLKINSEKEWRGGTDVRPGGYRDNTKNIQNLGFVEDAIEVSVSLYRIYIGQRAGLQYLSSMPFGWYSFKISCQIIVITYR